ncbi:MAG: GNAT family N-acetyltransferase [Kiritimatiellae bacterium]|nr:GNAT family N-acetyltransferase [Kiritimatiellia bacterium]MDD3545136.1 GNAT family N-acetyltransferase [Kiritimatiellia bacterium]MDD4024755.1 GNAT family N-acetyltransferase [Kiritimatiellia bacterium]MDD4621955.1 GNAT family N-acetyltransferase [Kiritimatiellia bacterium]
MQEQKGCEIRPAKLKDVEHIFDLIRKHENDLIVRSVGDITQNIDRFVVCESEGRVVGCAAWKILPEIGDPEKASVEIQSVAVSGEYRRKNIGSLIVAEIFRRVRPFEPVQAIVLTFAPEFFRSIGFKEIAKTQVMHKLYMGCINCTKHANPFTCPEIAMAMDLRKKQ